ncbi:MAG: hypothetical protein ACXVA3_13455 [Vulcanimicrobiaceae bacterium]
MYASPYTSAPIQTLSNALNQPLGVAFSPRGNLFVTNYGNNTVTEYAPPYSGVPIARISSGISGPIGLAFDAGGQPLCRQ